MIEYLNLKILNYILLLKWNILWNSYFQDSMSLYMMHLVAFHNRVLLYLVIILIAIIVCLINLFIPLSLNYLSNRTLPVIILTHYNLLPIKTYIIFILYKWFESWRSETIKEILKLWDEDSKRWTYQRKEAIDYKIYNYFLKLFGILNDENKYNYNIVSVKSDVYKKVTNISEDFNLELILSQDSWDIDLEDIELFLKQKQAANMLDYMPINRGFYWNDKNFNKFLSLDTMNKIRDLKSIKYFVGIFSSYKNIEPRLVNTKSNISKINYIYEILSFKHSKELEIFFTSIPTIIILTIISPSIALLIETDTEIEDPALYVKVQGSQWYWTYENSSWILNNGLLNIHSRINDNILPHIMDEFGKFGNSTKFLHNCWMHSFLYELRKAQWNIAVGEEEIGWYHTLNKINYKFNSNLETAEISDTILNKHLNKVIDISSLNEKNNLLCRDMLNESILGIFPSTGIFNNISNFEDNYQIKNRRLLTATNHLVLPTNVNIKFLITSSDVLHSWAVPNLGLKLDATPGRLNATQVMIKAPGEYLGQCSELCGPNHYAMPIVIKAVSQDEYNYYLSVISQKNILYGIY